MTSERGVPRRRPPRPVHCAPVDGLLARAEDLAKAWLLELLEQSTLQRAPAILAAELSHDGPLLCRAVARALGDQRELQRLDRHGELEGLASRAGELAGASEPEASAQAVDALRAVMWAAVRDELDRPDADEVEALAERLARVTDVVRAAVLRRFMGRDATLDTPAPLESPAEVPDRPSATEAIANAHGEDDGDVAPRPESNGAAHALPADSLWRGALEDEVARAQRSGAKLALLLAQLHAPERVPAREPAHVASRTFGRFAQAVRSAVRRDDILACETESRAWVIARSTGRAGARALASRIAHGVQDAEPCRGGPLTVGIGIAVLGEDADDAMGLIGAADQSAFAASSPHRSDEEPPGAAGADGHPPGDGGPRLVG